MTTCWILLGKTLFNGAHFLLDVGGKLQEITVPFDMEVDLLPRFLERREKFSFPLPSCFESIIGDSPLMQAKKREAYKAAVHNVSVLLIGESGTGKEVFAQAIHHASSRRGKNFEAINCGGIPANLLEDMLFGHCKGAFTGASTRHLGLVERANGGTLFLDELGELPAEMQSKLLRFLQPSQGEQATFRNFVPVGGEQLCTTDVRVIAATNRNIMQMVRRQVGEVNSFRMDLFQRIGTIIIELPPLREHKEDVLPLAQAFLDRINKEFRLDDGNYHDKKFSDDAINYLMECSWKDSNVRGLQNAVYRGATMSEGEWIRAVDLGISSFEPIEEEQSFPLVPPGGGKVDLECIIDSLQRRWINEALKRFPRNSTKAAEWLGLKNYQTLLNKMRKLGISHDFRS